MNYHTGNSYQTHRTQNAYRPREEHVPVVRMTTITPGQKTGYEINNNKRMTTSEEAAHSALTAMISAAQDFAKYNDVEFLEKYLNSLYNRLSPDAIQVVGDMRRNISAFITSYKDGTNVKDDSASCDMFRKTMLKMRAPLEPKWIRKVVRDEDALKDYMKSKSPDDLYLCMKEILKDYKEDRTDEKRERYNKVLGLYGKKIEQVPYSETSMDERKVIRYSFEGAFIVPTKEDEAGKTWYSDKYYEFMDKGDLNPPKSKYKEVDYDLEKSPVIQAIRESKNMSKMLTQIRTQLVSQQIPPEVFEQCNISDIAHMLYKGYSKDRNKDKAPTEGMMLPFKDVNPACDDGAKKQFWKEFSEDDKKMEALGESMLSRGADPKYVGDLLDNIREKGTVMLENAKNSDVYKQPTPDLSVHHKFYIQDATSLGDMMKVNDLDNFVVVVDFGAEKNHDLFHDYVDRDIDGVSERLVDLQDGKNGKSWVVSAGMGKDSYAKPISANVRETYQTKAISKEGRE